MEKFGSGGEELDNGSALDGLFNFTVENMTAHFLTPCFDHDGYQPVVATLPDGRSSPTADDVRCGRVSEARLFGSMLHTSSQCFDDEFLLGGRCQPCPHGARCLPGILPARITNRH